jgi:hypothetical protein
MYPDWFLRPASCKEKQSAVKKCWTKREYCAGKKIFWSVSEITNVGERKFVNVVNGVFKNNQALWQKLFFLPCQEVCEVNQTIAYVLSEALQTLASWCEILRVVASYRCHTIREKRAEGLSVSCPGLILVMCLIVCFSQGPWNNSYALSRCRQISG